MSNPILDEINKATLAALKNHVIHDNFFGESAIWHGISRYDYSGMGKLRGGLKDPVKRHYDMGLTKEQIIPLVRAVRKQKLKAGKEQHKAYVKDRNERAEREWQNRLMARRVNKCR